MTCSSRHRSMQSLAGCLNEDTTEETPPKLKLTLAAGEAKVTREARESKQAFPVRN